LKADWKEYREELKLYARESDEKQLPIKDSSDRKNVLIIGNSHARDFFVALQLNSDLFYNINPYFINYEMRCILNDLKRKELFNDPKYIYADTIVVATRFQKDSPCIEPSSDPAASDVDGLRFLINESRITAKKVIVVAMGPEFEEFTVDNYLSPYFDQKEKFIDRSFSNDLINKINRKYFETRRYDWREWFDLDQEVRFLVNKESVPLIDKYAIFCKESDEVCIGITPYGGNRVFYDTQHLSIEGARYMGQKISESADYMSALTY